MHRLSGKFHLIPTSRHLRLCEYVPETKRAAKRPSQGSGRPKCKREWVAEDRFGSDCVECESAWPLTPDRRLGLTLPHISKALHLIRDSGASRGSTLDAERGQYSEPKHIENAIEP